MGVHICTLTSTDCYSRPFTIDAATERFLAGASAGVAVTGRRLDRINEVVSQIETRGGRTVGISLDVTDHDATVHCIDQVTEALCLPTILVDNAGVPDAQRAHRRYTRTCT
ncbi:SDR family NAD(P)-dependent oxidoreductase [Nocardia gamkensis]|uniref:SDR family NAD(P)-dependent oxidoreductase n=1 Tax=Nocardia gamkensis TaxID=352869 RepID=A0A7X6KZG6_9NOCA|nr:SDR family NAD(P)-dependent oxidoreductase [Nocardia gamkensis]